MTHHHGSSTQEIGRISLSPSHGRSHLTVHHHRRVQQKGHVICCNTATCDTVNLSIVSVLCQLWMERTPNGMFIEVDRHASRCDLAMARHSNPHVVRGGVGKADRSTLSHRLEDTTRNIRGRRKSCGSRWYIHHRGSGAHTHKTWRSANSRIRGRERLPVLLVQRYLCTGLWTPSNTEPKPGEGLCKPTAGFDPEGLSPPMQLEGNNGYCAWNLEGLRFEHAHLAKWSSSQLDTQHASHPPS